MGDEAGQAPLLPRPDRHKRILRRSSSHALDELRSFRSCLRWMCVDQSSAPRAILSWSVFVLFALVVPCLSHFMLACADCDARHRRSHSGVVQISLSSVAVLSFLCLSRFLKRYGLRRFLFFDKLCDESETVRSGYTQQIDRSLKIVAIFVLPCFAAEGAYKIWWYSSEATRIPFMGSEYLSDAVACFMELCSWLYRTSVFFLACVLFHLICHLQILRLQDFAKVFQVESDVGRVLREHLRIRRHLRIISHRFRGFILWTLILVTGSQFASLLITTKSHSHLTFFRAGELALCSMTLPTGLFILLRSATKITHRAQAVACTAAKWHVCATVDSLESAEEEVVPAARHVSPNGRQTPATKAPASEAQQDEEEEEEEEKGSSEGEGEEEDDDGDNHQVLHGYAHCTISFQKRQALVTYFENNKAGITVYGFMLDRSYIHTIFGIELSLVLWLLGKTIS
uniref:Uncharacterized protein n=1 Tax=Kalanchoe fedtschenkoi TaxID=63787 RepID=A0A7N0VA00_KALFE